MEQGIKTSFNITRSTSIIAHAIVRKTGIKYKTLHHVMIEDFYNGDRKIEPRLEIRAYTDPYYVKKKVIEQITMSKEDYGKIEELVEQLGAPQGVILFQAMLNFCEKWAKMLWTEEEFTELFKIKNVKE